MRAIRLLLAIALWPFVWASDRLHHVDPPASVRAGVAWALRAAEQAEGSDRGDH